MEKTTKNAKGMTVQTVQIGKQTASFLVPNYNDGQKLAVIDEGVLKYLKTLLPKASTREIITDLRANLMQAYNDNNLLMAVNECRDFIAFHTSVNLIGDYFNPSVKVEMEAPFNVTRELTITEKSLRINELKEELVKLEADVAKYNEEFEEQFKPQPVAVH